MLKLVLWKGQYPGLDGKWAPERAELTGILGGKKGEP